MSKLAHRNPSKGKHSCSSDVSKALLLPLGPFSVSFFGMATKKDKPASLANKFDAEKQADFLRMYAATGQLNKCARAVGHAPSTVYACRKRDPEFEDAVLEAKKDFTETIEAEIIRRGRVGVLKPVFQKGIKVGEIREFSDTLLLALAKRHIPEYREKHQVDVNHTGGVLVVPEMGKDSDEWERNGGDKRDAKDGQLRVL